MVRRRTWRMSSWNRATVAGDCESSCVFVIVNWYATDLPGMRLKHLRTTQDLVPEGLLNHCESFRSTFHKTVTKCEAHSFFFFWSIVKISTDHVHDSKQTLVETAHFHPATCNLAHWLIRHVSPTIYQCFALPQLLNRWRHQSGIFWMQPRIKHVILSLLGYLISHTFYRMLRSSEIWQFYIQNIKNSYNFFTTNSWKGF
jgi:hypothetical protein